MELYSKVKKAVESSRSRKGQKPILFSIDSAAEFPIICQETFRENIEFFSKTKSNIQDPNEIVLTLVELNSKEKLMHADLTMRLQQETIQQKKRHDREIESVVEEVEKVVNEAIEKIRKLYLNLRRKMVDCIFQAENVFAISEVAEALEKCRTLEMDLESAEMGHSSVSEALEKHLRGEVIGQLDKMQKRISAIEKKEVDFELNPTENLKTMLKLFYREVSISFDTTQTKMSTLISSKKPLKDLPVFTNCQVSNGIGYCKGTSSGCTSNGTVWGSNPYTTDSVQCLCAVHAGLINKETGGYWRVTDARNYDHYAGSVANGVTSTEYGNFQGHRITEI